MNDNKKKIKPPIITNKKDLKLKIERNENVKKILTHRYVSPPRPEPIILKKNIE